MSELLKLCFMAGDHHIARGIYAEVKPGTWEPVVYFRRPPAGSWGRFDATIAELQRLWTAEATRKAEVEREPEAQP